MRVYANVLLPPFRRPTTLALDLTPADLAASLQIEADEVVQAIRAAALISIHRLDKAVAINTSVLDLSEESGEGTPALEDDTAVQQPVKDTPEWKVERMVRKFFRTQQENWPQFFRKKVGQPQIDNSIRVIKQLQHIDKYSLAQIREVIKWAVRDSFWSVNLRSLASLRNKGRNGELKFVNILSSMMRSGAMTKGLFAALESDTEHHNTSSNALLALQTAYTQLTRQQISTESVKVLAGKMDSWLQAHSAELPDSLRTIDKLLSAYTDYLAGRYGRGSTVLLSAFNTDREAWSSFIEGVKNSHAH